MWQCWLEKKIHYIHNSTFQCCLPFFFQKTNQRLQILNTVICTSVLLIRGLVCKCMFIMITAVISNALTDIIQDHDRYTITARNSRSAYFTSCRMAFSRISTHIQYTYSAAHHQGYGNYNVEAYKWCICMHIRLWCIATECVISLVQSHISSVSDIVSVVSVPICHTSFCADEMPF